jgi:hypothetical protein
VGRGDAAEDAYREVIERLDRSGAKALLARTHLVFGEWLRRERRRRAAGEQLRGALEMLTDMGMEAFAHRGARAVADRRLRLAPGLFIVPRTVQYHLHKVFTKLEITSRSQLDGVLPPEPVAAVRSHA